METRTGPHTRPPAATAVGVLALLGALGAAVMALAHLGVPQLDALGPGRMLLPVAIGFIVGTALYLSVAVGAFTVRSWAWTAGLAVNALAFLSAAFPYRGPASAAAMAISGLAVAILVLPSGRRAFRAPASP